MSPSITFSNLWSLPTGLAFTRGETRSWAEGRSSSFMVRKVWTLPPVQVWSLDCTHGTKTHAIAYVWTVLGKINAIFCYDSRPYYINWPQHNFWNAEWVSQLEPSLIKLDISMIDTAKDFVLTQTTRKKNTVSGKCVMTNKTGAESAMIGKWHAHNPLELVSMATHSALTNSAPGYHTQGY
jgi:hypothetical protein